MKDLSQKTIKKIKEEYIHPKAKWKFLAENLLIWCSLAFLIIFGALSLSLTYYLLKQLDWDVLRLMNHLPLTVFFSLIPHFWLLLLAFFLVFAFILFRHTKKGYRTGGLVVVSLILILFLAIGFIVHYFRADENINNIFSKKVPGYQLVANNKERQWSQPNEGFLGGEITEIQENNFGLKDFQGNNWQIGFNKETLIRPSVNLQPEEKIKVIGVKNDEKKFQAQEIRPWEGKGMMRGKMGERKKGNGE